MANIKAWRVGDVVKFNRYKWSPIIISGRIIARYPDTGIVDVIDTRGHVWRVARGNYGR